MGPTNLGEVQDKERHLRLQPTKTRAHCDVCLKMRLVHHLGLGTVWAFKSLKDQNTVNNDM